jgi:C_GCAxxG_C_C family probable redox protein
MDNKRNASNLFAAGFNCAQAVLAACGRNYGIDEPTALRIACGFGGGCGRQALTCGAVSGAFMVIGLKHGMTKAGESAAKEKTYGLVREFSKRFIARNGSVNCAALLGCDIGTSDGYKHAVDTKLFSTKCRQYVEDAVEIVKETLKYGDRIDTAP